MKITPQNKHWIGCLLFLIPAWLFAGSVESDTLLARTYLNQHDSLMDLYEIEASFIKMNQAQALYQKHQIWEMYVECQVLKSQLCDYIGVDSKIRESNLALAYANEHLDPGHRQFGLVYRQKGEGLNMIGEDDSSIYYYQLAKPILEENRMWEDLGWCYILMSNSYYLLRKENEGIDAINEAKKLANTHNLDDFFWSSLHSAASVLYGRKGDLDQAINSIKESIRLEYKLYEGEDFDPGFVSTFYYNLGVFYKRKGDYERSRDCFQQLINLAGEDDFDNLYYANLRIGEFYLKSGKPQEALPLLKKSIYFKKQLPETPRQKRDLHIAYNFIGEAFLYMEAYDSAYFYLEDALTIDSDFNKYLIFGKLGETYLKDNKPQKAIFYLEKSIEMFQGFNSSGYYASAYYTKLGEAYLKNNEVKEAMKYFQLALITNHEHFSDSVNYHNNPGLEAFFHPIYFLNSLASKAKGLRAFKTQKDRIASLKTYQLAIELIDILRTQYLIDDSELILSQKFKSIYEGAIQVAFELYQETGNESYLHEAFLFSEKSKAAVLLQALIAEQGQKSAGVPDSLIRKEKDLAIDVAFYQKGIAEAKKENDTDKLATFENYLSEKRLSLAKLREELETNYPEYYQLKYDNQVADLASVQANFTSGNRLFLEYFIGNEEAFVFVVSSGSVQLISLGKQEILLDNVTAFIEELQDWKSFHLDAKQAFADYNEISFQLYDYLLGKVIDRGGSGINELIIVPDGILNFVAFEALTIEDHTGQPDFDFSKLPYLIYQFKTHYTYSATLLTRNQAQQKELAANVTCLGMAPAYDPAGIPAFDARETRTNRDSLAPLTGTLDEIKAIQSYFSGTFGSRGIATEGYFKQNAPAYGLIHLAMHGKADPDSRHAARLIFALAANDSSEDELLHQYEIANMNLNAQLVVLSACETGLGKYVQGEGVFSLARSFMYAGVPSVVMSLWKVNDRATSMIMPEFYKNLSKGKQKGTALHKAKLNYLETASPEMLHPFFWAGFVLLGDSQPIRMNNGLGNYGWALALGLMLLIGGAVFFVRRRK